MRRLAATLALLAIFLHATLLPWHAAARTPAVLEAQQLAHDLMIICHGAGGTTTPDAPAQLPGDPGQQCPICKGIMGFGLVVLAAAELGLLHRVERRIDQPLADDTIVTGVSFTPRSRGPPLLV